MKKLLLGVLLLSLLSCENGVIIPSISDITFILDSNLTDTIVIELAHEISEFGDLSDSRDTIYLCESNSFSETLTMLEGAYRVLQINTPIVVDTFGIYISDAITIVEL